MKHAADPPPSMPTLRTERLVLRPFVLEDAPTVQRLAGNRDVAATTLNIPHPYEDGQAESWIGTHGEAWSEKRFLTLAVTAGADGLVGAVSLELEMKHRRGELGYWIGQPFWGHGYATEASRALIRYAFAELGLNKIGAHYLGSNPASGRVMEKLGMQREGLLRQQIVKWNRLEDIVVYGILEDDREGT